MNSYIRVPHYNAPHKYLVIHNGKPFCITNKPRQAANIVMYLDGYIGDDEIMDGKIIKLKKALED